MRRTVFLVARTAPSSMASATSRWSARGIPRILSRSAPDDRGCARNTSTRPRRAGGRQTLQAAPARGDDPLLRTAGTLEDVRWRAGSRGRAARAARVRRGRGGGLPALRDPFVRPDSGQVSGLRVVPPCRVFVSTSRLLSELYRAHVRLRGAARGSRDPSGSHSTVVSVARHMGPGVDVFARVMGPPNRQGHGARVAGDLTIFARVMGPADRQGHGATCEPGGD